LQKSDYIEDNLNPLFYKTFELIFETNTHNRSDLPPFIIDVWDKDFGMDGDDFLARAVIYPETAAIVE